MTVERDSSREPLKHERVRELILELLSEGNLAPGDRIPSQAEMASRFGVSQNTVRESVASLVQQGLLSRVHGKGTFVARRRPSFRTIAVVIPHMETSRDSLAGSGHNIMPSLVSAIEREAVAQGAAMLLYLTSYDSQTERHALMDVLDRRVDGLILLYTGGSANLDCLSRIRDAGIRTVMIDRYLHEMDFDHVTSDNVAGAYVAVSHLVGRGFRRIYHLTVAMMNTAVEDRLTGYSQAMQAFGLTPEIITLDPDGVSNSPYPAWTGATCDDFPGDLSSPFALFVSCAQALEEVWPAIEAYGVPHDRMALACFDHTYTQFPDDICFVQLLQPLHEIGRESVRAILCTSRDGRAVYAAKILPQISVSGGAPHAG